VPIKLFCSSVLCLAVPGIILYFCPPGILLRMYQLLRCTCKPPPKRALYLQPAPTCEGLRLLPVPCRIRNEEALACMSPHDQFRWLHRFYLVLDRIAEQHRVRRLENRVLLPCCAAVVPSSLAGASNEMVQFSGHRQRADMVGWAVLLLFLQILPFLFAMHLFVRLGLTHPLCCSPRSYALNQPSGMKQPSVPAAPTGVQAVRRAAGLHVQHWRGRARHGSRRHAASLCAAPPRSPGGGERRWGRCGLAGYNWFLLYFLPYDMNGDWAS
jgi:hypothetical protein